MNTPSDLRAQADELHRQAEKASAAGDARLTFILLNQEILLRELACEMERRAAEQPLTNRSPVVHDEGMTEAQIAERAARQGRSRARALASESTSAAGKVLYDAITNDTKGPDKTPRWGSGRVYAKRLKISPASLTNYLDGTSPCPLRVDKLVRADFPQLFSPKILLVWPRGVVS